jgi:hypothetical protein
VKPSHANDNLKADLIQRTQQLWQPRLRRDLTLEDARQITFNVTGFFSVLAEWSRAEVLSPANDAGHPAASHTGRQDDIRSVSVRPRVSELHLQGEIEPTGARRNNGSGISAQCWRAAKPTPPVGADL